jgi:hypothetical protein
MAVLRALHLGSLGTIKIPCGFPEVSVAGRVLKKLHNPASPGIRAVLRHATVVLPKESNTWLAGYAFFFN